MSIFRKNKNQLLKHIEKKDNKKDLINKKTILLSTIATSVAITPIASTIYFAASSDQHYYVDQQRLGFQAAFNKLQEKAEVYEYEREINAT